MLISCECLHLPIQHITDNLELGINPAWLNVRFNHCENFVERAVLLGIVSVIDVVQSTTSEWLAVYDSTLKTSIKILFIFRCILAEIH